MAGKASLLHYFKPKPTPAPIAVVEVEEASPVSNGAVEVAELEESSGSTSTGDVEVPEASPVSNEGAEVKVVQSEDEEEDIRPVRRSTRASASNARKAWNYNEESSSSDDGCDFKRGTRKRGRPSGGGRQATLSKTGTLITKKEKENSKPIKSKKKKVKLDPEREAFLRSGVPDVIEKAKKKSLENGNKNKKSGADDEEVTIIQETKRKQLDAETLAFLHSGVPDSVLKAQQSVDKRKEQDDFLVNMGFFPKTSHVYNYDVDEKGNENSGNDSSVSFRISAEKPEEFPDIFLGTSPEAEGSESQDFNCLSSQDSGIFAPVGLCCGENPIKLSSPKSLNVKTRFRHSDSKKKQETPKNDDMRPWIDQMRVTNVKNLVVDKNALETFTRWLKQWKSDIRDDGGTSRKQEQKKKRGNSSDSDFVTSDEGESEMKKKSVLLLGPNGCGKTATVYVLAKHYDFQVVEVNFSTRRPGKEVLQRVEEAVLSHHLKSSHNCLVLFKDIDLLHSEEDEGFCSAVAQLITTAVRPIVMTSSLPSNYPLYLIDSKLDRKDPLRISFTLPKASEIVEKILKPILSSTKSILESGDSQLDRWLDSIVRHSGCDIRQCINQLQLLLSTSADITRLSNQDIHLHSNPFLPHLVDLNFPRQSLLPSSSDTKEDSQLGGGDDEGDHDDEEVNLTVSARKKRCITQLDSLSDYLELFGDLDGISRISSSRPTRNVNIFGDMEEANWHWNHMSGMRSPFFTRLEMCLEAQKRKEDCDASKLDPKWMRELVLENDVVIDNSMEIKGVNDEIGEYCDSGIDWESCAAVRTIVKNNVLDGAAGRVQKRHGRMASYFNRLDRRLVDRIQGTFGFQEQLDSIKLYS